MKLFLLCLGVTAALALGMSSTAVAAGPFAQTSGAGKTTGGNDFNFTAHAGPSGPVGQMHLTNSAGSSAVARVTCVSTLGSDATLAGIISRGDSPTFPPGAALIFQVEDNGPPGQGTPDLFIPSAGPPGQDQCNIVGPIAVDPLTQGNIVVDGG